MEEYNLFSNRAFIILNMVCLFCLLVVFVNNGCAQPLFEAYTQTSGKDLAAETQEMSQQIVQKFSQQSMESFQQKIYFYEYFSNLKKLVLYGGKLANYAEYDQDLSFAKKNELFKGLPEKETQGKNTNRASFVNEKYKMMHTNIKNEIDTYKDLIQGSLDACEHLSLYELTPSSMAETNKDRIRSYLEADESCKLYFEKRQKLTGAWPGIEAAIKKQITRWQEKGLDPQDPIIDQTITEAISNDGAV